MADRQRYIQLDVETRPTFFLSCPTTCAAALSALAAIASIGLLAGCQGLGERTPPPPLAIDAGAVARMKPGLAFASANQELTGSVKALLTYLATADLVPYLQPAPMKLRGQRWRMTRIFVLEGGDVSVSFEQGQWRDLLHFAYRRRDRTWTLLGRKAAGDRERGVVVATWDGRQ